MLTYSWTDAEGEQRLDLAPVKGTHGEPYAFGEAETPRLVEVDDFFIGTVPVTQALWTHVAGGSHPALRRGRGLPQENVSWDDITRPGGFLHRVNASPVHAAVLAQLSEPYLFRLPTETEWEYAARGGPQWRDGFRFSGSNDIDAVAWYDRQHGDHTQPVARKAPNQLGLYDMSGNVWEWCHDAFTEEVSAIPTDGSAVHHRLASSGELLTGLLHSPMAGGWARAHL